MLSHTDKVLGTVRINESRRARSVSIKVSRSGGAVTLTYPIGYPYDRAIELLEKNRDRIFAAQRKYAANRSMNPPATSYDKEQLRAKAKEHLPERIKQISEQIKMPFGKLTIRATRSKWGSCSSENNISLSIYLMILPQHLIDFIIIHELCHTVHHNHSPKFHALVNYICQGREKEFERELRSYTIG